VTAPEYRTGVDDDRIMSDAEWNSLPMSFKLRVFLDIVINPQARREAHAAAEDRLRREGKPVQLAGLLLHAAQEHFGRRRSAAARVGAGDVVARLGVLLLPRSSRCRYLEEWRGELHDLRADGAPWWRRVGHVARLGLQCAPLTAFVLRRSARRAVD
jgi:hypothetical protein